MVMRGIAVGLLPALAMWAGIIGGGVLLVKVRHHIMTARAPITRHGAVAGRG
ncbi:hypothetical protein WDZ92_17655 [Nostoc sp. NIES-2111]